jgi:hypothetical protein
MIVMQLNYKFIGYCFRARNTDRKTWLRRKPTADVFRRLLEDILDEMWQGLLAIFGLSHSGSIPA